MLFSDELFVAKIVYIDIQELKKEDATECGTYYSNIFAHFRVVSAKYRHQHDKRAMYMEAVA